MLSSQISYQIIRSSRKTMSLEIKADGSVVVRASPSFRSKNSEICGRKTRMDPEKSGKNPEKRCTEGERTKAVCPGKTASAE